MTYIRDTLENLTPRQRAAWERKANTLHRLAGALLSEVISAHGIEHRLTDDIDNVLHMTENLMGALRPEKPRKPDDRLAALMPAPKSAPVKTSHIRSGGISGGRPLNRDDAFEIAVAAAAGSRIIESGTDAADVWGSITNTDWRHRDGDLAAFSFRAAGDVIAAIRGEGDYMDWYSSSLAGVVASWFAESMAFEGWVPVGREYD